MTTTGIDCGQLQSILKFRSSLFKGLAGYGAAAPRRRLGGAWGGSPEKKGLAGYGAVAPRKKEKACKHTRGMNTSFE